MPNELQGKRVAFLATDGVEQVEYTKPREAMQNAGADVELVAPTSGEIRGYNKLEAADTFQVGRTTQEARASDYDALILPGGVANPDLLRMDSEAVRFVREFFDQSKPVAAICHGPWTLVEAGVVKGRTLTSFPSLQTDIRNAGGQWVDEEVCMDGTLVTSRKPADLESFCNRTVDLIGTQTVNA